MSKSNQDQNLNFEQSIAELEAIVSAMESGELPLEESLKHFERGIQLVRTGQAHLQKAEQKVQILMQQTQQLEPFDVPSEPKA